MGLNAYFAYQVVGFHGTGRVSYRLALTAVFVEGWIFVALSLLGMRQWLVKVIPPSIKIASGVGIGLFLTEVGLSSTAGLGAITAGGRATPLALGGCPSQYINADSGLCESHVMTNPQVNNLHIREQRPDSKDLVGNNVGRLPYRLPHGIQGQTGHHNRHTSGLHNLMAVSQIPACSTLLTSSSRETSFTYFPYTPDGDSSFNFFKEVVGFHPISRTLNANEWNVTSNGSQFALALFTFLYVDIMDASATLYSMARFAGAVDTTTGDFPRSTLAYCTDALTISIGSLFGLSPVTAFIESGAGIAEGGKTGLTAIVTGTCFLISLFFAPIFASIPPWATGGTLILVGMLMIRQVTAINWKYIGDALPAFVTLAFMPLSYSIAYGLIAYVTHVCPLLQV